MRFGPYIKKMNSLIIIKLTKQTNNKPNLCVCVYMCVFTFLVTLHPFNRFD